MTDEPKKESAAPAVLPKGASQSRAAEKVWDLFWKTVSELFRFSYSAEIYIDAEGRKAGERLYDGYFAGKKGDNGFSREDVGELISLCGKAAYFGIPSLILIYFLGFIGAVFDVFCYLAYFYSRSKCIREAEKREMREIEALVEKGKNA